MCFQKPRLFLANFALFQKTLHPADALELAPGSAQQAATLLASAVPGRALEDSQTKAVADAAKDSAETSKAAAETSKDLLNKTTAAAQQAAASAAATNYALGPDESGRLSFFIKKST